MRKYFSLVLLTALSLGSSGICMDLESESKPPRRITLKLKDGAPTTAISSIATDFGLTQIEKRRTKGFYKASINVADLPSVLNELNHRSEVETAYVDTPVAGKLLEVH